jgi:saccharopine dehydrogenase-like NADP-dependent oxidoreductase
MKTINIFLNKEDSIINIMPEGFDPGIIEAIVRETLEEVLNEESDFEEKEVIPAKTNVAPLKTPAAA